VDVTPVVWVGLISLLRELLVGQQGLLTQVLLRSQALA
jgi:YggT family protein